MKQTLKGCTNIFLLVVLWDYVFVDADYLLLRHPHHIALSRDTVYVDFDLPDNGTVTPRNICIILLDISSNKTVTKKELPANETQGSLEFECFYFMAAGPYQFQMILDVENGSNSHLRSSILNVTWPMFHIDLNRTSQDVLTSFRIGVFTNEQLCQVPPDSDPAVVLEVEHGPSLQELEGLSIDGAMPYKTHKKVPMVTSQWLEFECASVRPDAAITVSMKSMLSNSVIASMGPIDLVKKFKYKLITATEQKCDASVTVLIIPPPCTYAQGKMVVYKEAPRSLEESITSLAEIALQTGENTAHFKCTLFDIGKNKYCFELFIYSSETPRDKECMEIRREIETWSLWQSWSPCSTTCGEGQRERYRHCLTTSTAKPSCSGSPKETSSCSLEDCSTVKPSSKSTTHTKDDPQASNIVTITGISLCLFIIIVTILITVWRKRSKAQKCSPVMRHSSAHSVNCRKNSDEENIFQLRESCSDAGEGLQENAEEAVHIPLNYRPSVCAAEEPAITENDGSQSNAQKIIPPIFSYRLAQQQLKEMKQRGLTEATKVYQVSPNPMADTAVDDALTPPLVTDNSEEATANKFRIQSPFLEHKSVYARSHGERPSSKSAFPPLQVCPGMSPSQTLPRLSHVKNKYTNTKHFERGYQKNPNFRRTSSFHETKHNKPHRERSLSTLSPRQTMFYNSRTRTWEHSAVERSKHKSIRADQSPKILFRGADLTVGATGYCTTNQYMQPVERKPDLIGSRYLAARASKAERPEQNRIRKGPSPVDKTSLNKTQNVSCSPKDSYQRNSALTPAQHRREKCQSFPRGTEYSFYDNTTFGLTEAEQRMIDLPGYFASNEEDETSTLSVERLVI
ncbi:hypothetical protein FKM82_009580 [Ascaphus truei]